MLNDVTLNRHIILIKAAADRLTGEEGKGNVCMNLHMWELQQCLDARVEKDEKSLQHLQIVIYECT